MEDDLLDSLLSAEAAEFEVPPAKLTKTISEDPNFLKLPSDSPVVKNNNLKSVIHSGDTDSSEDESNRENSKYNECGKDIKRLLFQTSPQTSSYDSSYKSDTMKPKNDNIILDKIAVNKKPEFKADVYTDPVFGIRIVKPLISMSLLKTRMDGREAVPTNRIKKFVEMLSPNKDWVIAGVLTHKVTKTSKKGSAYSIWTISDLHGDLKTICLFLFSSAHKDLWKCTLGTVVGILNPNVLNKRENSRDEVALSVDNVQKVMIIGQSKDLGFCKSTKKSGGICNSLVNLSRCEFCVYHIQQEYRKCSKRSELQSTFQGRGLTALRNKVLGKNEVFYAGKSFTAIPAGKSKKLKDQDNNRMNLLSGNGCLTNATRKTNTATNKKKSAARLDISVAQRLKDIELLKKLGGGSEFDLSNKTQFSATPSSTVTLQESKSSALNVINKLKANKKDEETVKITEVKLSSDVTLEESKNTALNVIAKLKINKKENKSPVEAIAETPSKGVDFLDENNLSDLDFGLSDDEFEKSINDAISKAKAETSELVLSNTSKKLDVSKQNDTQKSKTCQQNLSKSMQSKISHNNTQPISSNAIQSDSIPTNKAKDDYLKPTGALNIPMLSGFGKQSINLNAPISSRRVDRAKLNALKWVQRNGPIKTIDPNKKSSRGTKRALEVIEQLDPKKQKIQQNEFFSDRFKKMMAKTSMHEDLLEQRQNDEAEKYFDKLELKERMEEKMMTTYKIACKAVKCVQCKYTSFSASDKCKADRHTLKVYDAFKRFFKCGDCGHRTVSLDIIPILSCKNCGSGKWEKTTMMKEKKVTVAHTLSIRGGEQKHTNSNITDSNINLLVPDD